MSARVPKLDPAQTALPDSTLPTMPELRNTLAALVTAAVLFVLADFALAAHVQGVGSESFAAIARPLAFFVAAGLAGGLAGAMLGALSASTLRVSREAAAVGFGLAGTATAAIVIAQGEPFAAFSSGPRQALLWTGVWVGLGILLAGSSESSLARSAARLAQAVPPLAAGLAGYQMLVSSGAAWRWTALVLGTGLAAWAFTRTTRGLAVNAALAAGLLLSPWLGAPEPNLAGPSGVDTYVPLDPPRVILITIDALRADEPGFAGGAASTPNLDRLAAASVVFEQAYSTSGWTLPALASLHLGVSPWVHGAWTWAERPSDTPLSLAERFHSAGYLTAKVGDNFFLTPSGSGQALEQGFQVKASYPKHVSPRTAAFEFLLEQPWVDLPVTASTDDLFAWAGRWIEDHAQAPFFLWLHIYDPHQPYLPPAAFAPGVVVPAVDDPDADPEHRPKTPEQAERMRALYRGEIAYVDDCLGRLLERLRALGLYEDALIALTSDHGDEFYEHGGFGHGHTLYDELLRVPLLIKPPGVGEPRRISGRVSTLALAPTLLSLANVDYDPAAFSAGPLLFEEQPETPIFAAGIMDGEPQEAVLLDGLKLIRHVSFGDERLYDLAADPGERVNLASQRPDDVRRGLELLDRHNERSRAIQGRLGVANGRSLDYDAAEKNMLRSLGYVQ